VTEAAENAVEDALKSAELIPADVILVLYAQSRTFGRDLVNRSLCGAVHSCGHRDAPRLKDAPGLTKPTASSPVESR
jgi:hypothetical protein